MSLLVAPLDFKQILLPRPGSVRSFVILFVSLRDRLSYKCVFSIYFYTNNPQTSVRIRNGVFFDYFCAPSRFDVMPFNGVWAKCVSFIIIPITDVSGVIGTKKVNECCRYSCNNTNNINNIWSRFLFTIVVLSSVATLFRIWLYVFLLNHFLYCSMVLFL